MLTTVLETLCVVGFGGLSAFLGAGATLRPSHQGDAVAVGIAIAAGIAAIIIGAHL